MNLTAVFLTGLLAGGLTCLAVQGGLLAATVAQRGAVTGIKSGSNALPILFFLVAKLVAYTLLGFLLGYLGSFFQLTPATSAILLVAVAVFMVGTALSLLDVHPIFRYFILQPPKFLTRLVRNQAKRAEFFAPAMLGGMTVFVPCGTTQAMMALALASGNPLLGAAILFVFVLGTSPLFFVLGFALSKLGQVFDQKFRKVAAYTVIVLAVWNINSALALTGSTLTLQSLANDLYCTISICRLPAVAGAATGPATKATINIYASSYEVDNPVLKAGSLITLDLVNKGGRGCTQVFTIPRLGVRKIIPMGSSETIQITAPKDPGELAFTCGMGMFGGKLLIRA